jgi:outer membrane protein TolC
MTDASRCISRLSSFLLCVFSLQISLHAEPVPLKRVVELALAHSPAAAASQADEQRAFANYLQTRDQYIPQVSIGSGLGWTEGYPLSLEGSAPSIVNVVSQSALINPALQQFIKAARTDWNGSTIQSKDRREQIIQGTVLCYAELSRWETMLSHLQEEKGDADRAEQVTMQRIQEGVDRPTAQAEAKLTTARVEFRIVQAKGSIDILRNHLAHETGLSASSIETIPDSIPALPEVSQQDDLVSKAQQSSPTIQFADTHARALQFRAVGEHRSLWPSIDFAAQYALLATFNNYENFFRPGSFQQNNATVGISMRFPFLNFSQRARAQAADAEAVRAKKDADAARNQVSEETLRMQRAVDQYAAAQKVAELEFQVAQNNWDAVQIRANSGTATLHELDDARTQANERFNSLQDSNFQLERARISLLRATGDLERWVGLSSK